MKHLNSNHLVNCRIQLSRRNSHQGAMLKFCIRRLSKRTSHYRRWFLLCDIIIKHKLALQARECPFEKISNKHANKQTHRLAIASNQKTLIAVAIILFAHSAAHCMLPLHVTFAKHIRNYIRNHIRDVFTASNYTLLGLTGAVRRHMRI